MEGGVGTRKGSSSERFVDGRASQSPSPRHHYQHHQHHRNGSKVRQKKLRVGGKEPVVYYLSRSGQMEHPHFVEVPISSSEGLFLRDVISRLCVLKGKRMAFMYSWSCKRSYRNGFVWHDIAEDDLIVTTNENEYVLKGSEIIDVSPSGRLQSSITTINQITPKAPQRPQEHRFSSSPSLDDLLCRSCSSKTTFLEPIKPIMKLSCNIASTANASTQTDLIVQSNRRSPPRSNTLEALIHAEPRWSRSLRHNRARGEAKVRASDVLRQFLTCRTSLPNSRPKATMVATTMLGERDARGRSQREWYSRSLVEMERRMKKGDGGQGGERDDTLVKRSSSHRGRRNHRSPPPKDEMPRNEVRKDRNLDYGVNPNKIGNSQRSVDAIVDESERKKMTSKGRVRPHAAQSPQASSSNGISLENKGVSPRLASSHTRGEEREKVLRTEERLISGARVIIQSRPNNESSDGSCRP